MTEAGRLRYRPEIDGLRAVAVITVLLHHVWPDAVPGGYVGVDIFFVISGFLITGIVAGQMAEGNFSFGSFYERRIRRLVPALIVVLLAVLLAGWFVLLPSDYLASFRAALATTLFASNLEFWRILSEGYFAPDAKLNPLLHTWSLGVEEQFYLFFPLLLLACARYAPRRTGWVVLVGFFLSFAAAVLLVANHSVAVFFLTPFRAWELFAGALLALGMVPTARTPIVPPIVALSGLAAVIFSVFVLTPETIFPGWAALLPVAGSAAIIYGTGGSRPGIASHALSIPVVVYVGRISYSLYLWHWPLVVFSRYAFQLDIELGTGCAIIAASVVLAALSHRFVETPFRRRTTVSGGKRFVAASLGCSMAVAVVSAFGIASGGVRDRVNARANTFDAQRRVAVPFRSCDQKEGGCVLGDERQAPDVLFWGDSHMLAWAPAIDRELRSRGRAGYLAVHSACLPTPGGEVQVASGCREFGKKVEAFIGRSEDVHRVVIAANWSVYGVSRNDLASSMGGIVQRLSHQGKTVVILGSVPTYVRDVPFELARVAGGFTLSGLPAPMPDMTGAWLRSAAANNGAEYIDVARAMCSRGACLTHENGVAFYRDEQHLSVAGALRFANLIEQAAGNGTKRTHAD